MFLSDDDMILYGQYWDTGTYVAMENTTFCEEK